MEDPLKLRLKGHPGALDSLEEAASVNDPPARKEGGEGFGDAPPEGEEESAQSEEGEEQPEGFFLRVQGNTFRGGVRVDKVDYSTKTSDFAFGEAAAMNAYVLSHALDGERQRLELMSELLDPLERSHLERLGVRPGWRCLEVGCGNGSISQWLASQVAPTGQVVASDLETSYIACLQAPCLEVRQLDILRGEVEAGQYDLVVARALLHHLPDPERALRQMAAALKPGGVLLSIEPDMLPATVAEPEAMRKFWEGWFRWAESAGIDYFVGRKIAPLLDAIGLQDVGAEGHTAVANGGSKWADYWRRTVHELRPKLMEAGHVSEDLLAEFNRQLEDPHYWTSAITFVAASGRNL